ncbi:hypothetical protein BC828DRAFT_185242 [Blastocladiella britannica]|nr:hypothetical protein BC828DRAFT_185242 [Blastocladiella britannica]
MYCSVSQWSVAGLTCPYLSMSASLPSEVYMDVGSNLTVTGELVLSSSSPSQVPALSLGDSTLLTAIPTAPPVKYSLNTILASLSTTIAPNAAAGAGFAAVAASPQSSPLGCASMSPRSVGVVRAACPPSRRLVALGSVSSAATVLVNCTAPPGSSSSTAATQQYTVTADAGTWTDWDSGVVGAVAKSMAYNCSRFGQPQTAFYTYLYQPLLAVYDGPTFVTNVTADFALTEILGRNTFGYNMTASDAAFSPHHLRAI